MRDQCPILPFVLVALCHMQFTVKDTRWQCWIRNLKECPVNDEEKRWKQILVVWWLRSRHFTINCQTCICILQRWKCEHRHHTSGVLSSSISADCSLSLTEMLCVITQSESSPQDAKNACIITKPSRGPLNGRERGVSSSWQQHGTPGESH